MSAGTFVFTKEGFIQWLEDKMDEDHIIVFTNSAHGTLFAPSKKINSFRIPFAFSGAAIKTTGLNVILQNGAFGILILNQSDITEDGIKSAIKPTGRGTR